MKAAIHNPYLDTLGGGERYTAVVASALAKNGYKVDLRWKSSSIIKKLEDRFGIDLSRVGVTKDIKKGDGYEVCFWVSDGSIPLLRSRINLLHFQVPFTKVQGSTLFNKMKLYRINSIICNSNFTKSFIDKEYSTNSSVLYPPVDVEKFNPKRKKKIILSVGRFSQLKQAKRQDVLIQAFKKLFKSGVDDWELVLAGGAEVGADKYLKELEESIEDYPISIVRSPRFNDIVDLYGKAKIYWSASGYGVDEKIKPEKVEHFGISVVEAMAAGCIPIVYEAGGHKEIIKNNKNGYLWKDVSSLVDYTKTLIKDNKLITKVSEVSMKDSNKYSNSRFEEKLLNLLK